MVEKNIERPVTLIQVKVSPSPLYLLLPGPAQQQGFRQSHPAAESRPDG